MDKMPIHPCIGCVYYKACGNTNRTAPCYGRVTKSERLVAEAVAKAGTEITESKRR